jgi:glycosyltransferase involved in cell wall biosynthesis
MTPCYNEEAGIRECYQAIKQLFAERLPDYDYEHLFIDNCSQDRTVEILKEIAATDANVKIIVNSRNFGPHRSPYHGLLQTTGDAVIPMMADLQTPPSMIPGFVAEWEKGYKMVLAIRKAMREGFFLRMARHLFYHLVSRIAQVEQLRHFIGYGLFDRQVMDVIRKLDDPYPYFRGIITEIGFDKKLVEYDQPLRKHGRSRQRFSDLLEYAILGLSYQSKVPLRLITLTGFVISGLSFTVGMIYLIMKLIFWKTFSLGTAPIIIGVFFLGSIQLLFLGFVAEYVGMIYEQVRHRPLVIEKERVNC